MNIIITGASGGIGWSIVQAFAASGNRIWACASKENKEFEKNIAEISDEVGATIEPVYFDLLDETKTKTAISRIASEADSVDVLVNNAGIAHGGTLFMTPLSTIRTVYEVNVFAQILLMQLVGRIMAKQGDGCIVNICSASSFEHRPGYIAYGSSKAALTWLTKAVACELGRYGVRVNGIAPGLINTAMSQQRSDADVEQAFSRMAIKRFGEPDEVAQAVLFLSSDAAHFITGQIITLDGGRTL